MPDVYGFNNARHVKRALKVARMVLDRKKVEPAGMRMLAQSGGTCHEVDEYWIDYEVPTTGDAEIQIALDRDPDDMTGPVTDTITVDWDATADDFKTAFADHSEISPVGGTPPDDVDSEIVVFGGPFPSQPIYVLWKGIFAGRSIAFPSLNSSGLDAGTLRMRKVSSADWQGYV